MSTSSHFYSVTSPAPPSHSRALAVVNAGLTRLDPERVTVDKEAEPASGVDIEHVEVIDDPRKWSRTKKYFILCLVSGACGIAGLGASIYNPSIADVQRDLHTTPKFISLSISLQTLMQGTVPILWSSTAEIIGRKKIYVVSLSICFVGCIVAGSAQSIEVLIAMRCLQGAGGAAVNSIGAATLADMFEPHQRGIIMGIYYCAPLIGTALGPLLGGALTQGFSWRATFYFIAICIGIYMVAFLFFDDTFRRERSAVYLGTVKRRREEHAKKEQRKLKGSRDEATESHETVIEDKHAEDGSKGQVETGLIEDVRAAPDDRESLSVCSTPANDLRASPVEPTPTPPPERELQEIRLSLRDVNPIPPMVIVFRRPHNIAMFTVSGIIFGLGYSIAYTSARTLGNQYGFSALEIGLVLLAFGIGSMLGSILGGRWSDRVFIGLREKNGGIAEPEMRLMSTRNFMAFLPPAVAGFGWVCEQNAHIAVVCVMLFLCGFVSISIYSSTLAYMLDANAGRSSSIVALNSLFRGSTAFIGVEVAVPLQNAIGDGGLYSLWAGLLVIAELLILLVWWRGGRWREAAEARERVN